MIPEIAREQKSAGGHRQRDSTGALAARVRTSMKLGTSRWALDPVRVVASPVRARSSRGARLAT
jgi:hypothetical protein